MPAPVNLVTIHHEGAGKPSDIARGADGGYTYWIGASYYTRLRDVWSSYATLRFNHRSLDICLSGNRMEVPLYDHDIEMIQNACAEARSLGYVIDNPMVRPHRLSPYSSTVCPGDNTMARWSEVVAACRTQKASAPAPAPKPVPTPPAAKKGGAMDIVRSPSGKGYYIVAADGGVFCYGDAKFFGSMGGKKLNAPVVDMAVKPKGDGYILVSADGGVFAFGNVTYHGSMGGKKLNAPIVGCDFDAEGDGYWLLSQDGGVFTFGNTGYYGSAAGKVKY